MGRSRAGFFDRAREKGSRADRSGINGEQVHRPLEPCTERRYEGAMNLWLGYCTIYGKDPVSGAYDLETLKDFMNEVAHGMRGIEGGDSVPAFGSVRQTWKDFTAGFRRKHDPIPPKFIGSVKNFIKTTITEKLDLPLFKRERRYGTNNHLFHLATQMWGNDWHSYPKPGIRVSTWSEILDYAFLSARVGELLESSARAGSGRGLYHRDITFAVLRNENGEAEFAAQLARDAKSTTRTPNKRPEQAIHEGSEPRPFFLNPILPKLAICVARGAFRDYSTIEQLLDIPAPLEKEMHHLHWHSRVLDKPFYDSEEGEIEKANVFAKRLSTLCERRGYLCPPTVHDFRAEGLHIIDQLYSTAQRMKHGGHLNPSTHRNHYQPNNPGTDGQDAYLGGKLRPLVPDLFRGMTVPHNPNLLQSLPAEMEHEMEATPEFAALAGQLRDLKDERPSDEREQRRRKVYRDKGKLMSAKLREAQENQECRPSSEATEDIQSIGGHRARFARFCRLMPERERLAKSMLEVGSLRSPEGRSVLQDMIALCQQKTEVAFRPGLELEKCHCPGARCGDELEKGSAAQRWRHIYACHTKHLAKVSGSGELCFLCDEWILGPLEWERHCQTHLGSPQTLPVQCDPLIHCGTIAAAGFCPVCLGNPALSASERMKQFPDKRPWKDHVTRCVGELDDSGLPGCPLPWCKWPGQDALKRRFHLKDVHCAEFSTGTKRCSPDVAGEDKGRDANCRSKRRCVNQASPNPDDVLLPTTGYHFIDESVEIINSRPLSPNARGETSGQSGAQRPTSGPTPAILDNSSPSTSATYLSTSATEDRSPSTPFTDICAEPFENLLDPALLSSDRSTSRSSSPPSSHDIKTPQDGEEDEVELPSLHSLLNFGPPSSHTKSYNAQSRETLTEPTPQIGGWVEVPGPDGTTVLQELSDHEPDAQGPGIGDPSDERRLAEFAREGQPAVASANSSVPKRVGRGTDKCPRCGTDVPQSSGRRRKPLNPRQQRAFCEAHRLKDERNASKTEWALRGYPQIGWRRLDARLQKFFPALRGILNGATPSFYRSELESEVASRVKPRYRGMEYATAGYYGSRGQQVMAECIIFEFRSELPCRAVEDQLLRSVGVGCYINTVLIPELAVMLIKGDMKVGDERARQILQESARLGETLCGEE